MKRNDDCGLGNYTCRYCSKLRYVGTIYPCKLGNAIEPSSSPWGTACKP